MTRPIGPYLLPSTVILPVAPLMGAAHLRHAVGASKAVLWLWRKRYGFPRGHRDGAEVWTMTDAVANWCIAWGAKVERK